MNFRSATTALAATLVVGLASAQTPLPTPATPAPAAAAPATVATPPAPAPSVSKAWVLMDYATGQVLAGENIHEQ
ncbi:serine-type D-Ala-D-Ala carboxypeptidase, partial [Stenotrophomonas maltophilia]|nr:serine-type D-Ala-D-Ala carboxypeptidase [Stenotrophomonas maltophilia]